MYTGAHDALIVVDVQADFCPGGALPVPDGEAVVPVINRIAPFFGRWIYTRDWHPADHVCFSLTPEYKDMSWPPHAVQFTAGAQWCAGLELPMNAILVTKGDQPGREEYSAFQNPKLDLAYFLKLRKVERLFVCGLALDVCVRQTCLDSLAAGFTVYLVEDAVQGHHSRHRHRPSPSSRRRESFASRPSSSSIRGSGRRPPTTSTAIPSSITTTDRLRTPLTDRRRRRTGGLMDHDVSQRWAKREDQALLTDFYQLTMMAGYWKTGQKELRACFNYTFRELPPDNGFAVTAGLEQLLDLMENLRFTEQDIAYLASLNAFDKGFLDYLRDFRLTCNIEAIPEGSVVFPHEPVLQVEGPLIEAQLLETVLLNTLNYQTLVATKAARIRLACGEDNLVEFGLRRAQGPDGGLSGSRAAYIGGADSTSNVLAGKVFGIPVRGTHAHSWVMSFDSELEAFRAYAACSDEPILLVDTYDTLTSGLPNAVTVFKELRAIGRKVRPAIRLDSGDLARLSKAANRMFTQAGFDNPLIVASNELDEDLIADLKRQGAPINSWGVGTHLITASDYPALGGVYKLVAVSANGTDWEPRIKLSSNPAKMTDPGRKRVVRYYDGAGRPLGRHHPALRRGSRRDRPGPAGQAGAVRRTARPQLLARHLGRHPLREPSAAGRGRRRAGRRFADSRGGAATRSRRRGGTAGGAPPVAQSARSTRWDSRPSWPRRRCGWLGALPECSRPDRPPRTPTARRTAGRARLRTSGPAPLGAAA